jgi:tetratricopeptide (TPR) repeat protein
MGAMALLAGDFARAAACFEERLAYLRGVDDPEQLVTCLHNLGYTLVQSLGDLGRAEGLIREALACARAAGDRRGVGLTLRTLGLIATERGAPDQGVAYLEEGVAVLRALGDNWGVAAASIDLGNALVEAGDAAAARRCLIEVLALARPDGARIHLVHGLNGLGRAAAQGDPALAAQLWGAAEALREVVGAIPTPLERARQGRYEALARAALGAGGFAAAWEAGHALPLDEAIALARAQRP